MSLLHRLTRASRIILFLALAASTATGGCSKSSSPATEPPKQHDAEMPPRASDGGAAPSAKLEFLPSDGHLLDLIGERDLTNRYAATVMVEPDGPGLSCSGVLVHPRLVLTAGHCLCAPHKADLTEGSQRTLIDASTCAKRARVTGVLSRPVEGSSWPAMRFFNHAGAVKPHPALKILLDARAGVETSEADLAAILLEEPVAPLIAPSQFSATSVQVGQPLITVGFGNEKGVGGIYGTRYFKRGKVHKTPIPPDGRFLYEPQGAHFNTGYRGGACLHEDAKVLWLIGIVGLGEDREMSCTSLSLYVPWLLTQLEGVGAP